MNTSFRKITEISYELPSVYVINKNSDLKLCSFSESELDYVGKRIERGDDFIVINNLTRYTCLVVNDDGKPFFTQLESLRRISNRVFSVVKENDHKELIAVDLVNDSELITALV